MNTTQQPKFPRLTHRVIWELRNYLAKRDQIDVFQVELTDPDRWLFIENKDPRRGEHMEIDIDTTGTQFELHEVEELRHKLYPPIKIEKRLPPESKAKPLVVFKAHTNPNLNKKLTTLQVAAIEIIGADPKTLELIEKYEGGKRPQHQVISFLFQGYKYQLSRRGKIISKEQHNEDHL